jgi:hypothetical protein
MGASGEAGPRRRTAYRVAGIRWCCRAGQRRGGSRSASGTAVRPQRPAFGSSGAAGWLGRRYCRAVADARGGGHRGRTRPAGRLWCARGCRLCGDRRGLHRGHRHRACILAAPVLDDRDQAGDRLQCGGGSGSHRGRMAPLHGRASRLSLRRCCERLGVVLQAWVVHGPRRPGATLVCADCRGRSGWSARTGREEQPGTGCRRRSRGPGRS